MLAWLTTLQNAQPAPKKSPATGGFDWGDYKRPTTSFWGDDPPAVPEPTPAPTPVNQTIEFEKWHVLFASEECQDQPNFEAAQVRAQTPWQDSTNSNLGRLLYPILKSYCRAFGSLGWVLFRQVHVQHAAYVATLVPSLGGVGKNAVRRPQWILLPAYIISLAFHICFIAGTRAGRGDLWKGRTPRVFKVASLVSHAREGSSGNSNLTWHHLLDLAAQWSLCWLDVCHMCAQEAFLSACPVPADQIYTIEAPFGEQAAQMYNTRLNYLPPSVRTQTVASTIVFHSFFEIPRNDIDNIWLLISHAHI